MQNEFVKLGEVWNCWVFHLVCQNLFQDSNWLDLLRRKNNELELFEHQQAIEDDSRSAIGPLVVTEDLVQLNDEVVIVEVFELFRRIFDEFKKFVIFSRLINCLHHISWIRFVFNGQFLIQLATKIKVWTRRNGLLLKLPCFEIVNKSRCVEVVEIRRLMLIKRALLIIVSFSCKGYLNLVAIQMELWAQALWFPVSCQRDSFGLILFLKILVYVHATEFLALERSFFHSKTVDKHDIDVLALLLKWVVWVDNLLKHPAWYWNDDVIALHSPVFRKRFLNFFKDWIEQYVVIIRWMMSNFERMVIFNMCHHYRQWSSWMVCLKLGSRSPKTSHWLRNSHWHLLSERSSLQIWGKSSLTAVRVFPDFR